MTDWSELLREQAHRPYPPPSAPFAITMSWHDLLFIHFEVDVSALRAAVPRVFELDLWQGKAWVGVVPFYMSQVGPPALNQLPWTSRFEELNRGEIHHAPWPLQAAEAEILRNEMGRPHGLSLAAERPLLHFAQRLDVLAWPLVRTDRG